MEFWVDSFCHTFSGFLLNHSFFALHNFWWKRSNYFNCHSLYIMCLFFSGIFELSHYSLLSRNLNIMYPSMAFFILSWLRFSELLESVNWFHLFGKNLDCYFQISFSDLSSFFYSSAASMIPFDIIPQILEVLFILFCFSFFFFWWDNLYWFLLSWLLFPLSSPFYCHVHPISNIFKL